MVSMLSFMGFLHVGICYRCVVPSSCIHGLVSSVSLCGSWYGSDRVCIAFCGHLLLRKIHLAGLFPGEYCFASLATELRPLGFQDAGMGFGTCQFSVVTDDNGMRPYRCPGHIWCLPWDWMLFDLGLTKRYEACIRNLSLLVLISAPNWLHYILRAINTEIFPGISYFIWVQRGLPDWYAKYIVHRGKILRWRIWNSMDHDWRESHISG